MPHREPGKDQIGWTVGVAIARVAAMGPPAPPRRDSVVVGPGGPVGLGPSLVPACTGQPMREALQPLSIFVPAAGAPAFGRGAAG